MPTAALFNAVPADHLQFWSGTQFQAKRVPQLLDLKREDVSRIADVALSSVRYDDSMPESVRQHLEEIASTINSVAAAFEGDEVKTVHWFRTRNPLLGDVSPRDMIRLGRYERLRRFIVNAMIEEMASRQGMQPRASSTVVARRARTEPAG